MLYANKGLVIVNEEAVTFWGSREKVLYPAT
jgi:hypothetical protein